MNDHASQPRAGSDAKPVIPDGGLGSSMPAWLRQPPTWKQGASGQIQPEIPPPDTSTIDPSTFLEIDDLPSWLQAVARRVEANAGTGSNVRLAHERDLGHIAVEAADAPASHEPAPSPVTPVTDAGAGSETRDVHPLSPSSSPPAWWMSEQVVGGLMLAVVIVLIYVILVATGVL